MIHLVESVKSIFGRSHQKGCTVKDNELTPDMVPVIKLARAKGYNYALIASHYKINQGRIADVMKGRRFPDIPAAEELPPEFPSA